MRLPFCRIAPFVLWLIVDIARAVGISGQIGGPIKSVAVSGNHVIVGAGMRIAVIEAGTGVEIGVSDIVPDFIEDVAVAGSFVYLAAGKAGVRVFDISDPAAPEEIGAWKSFGIASGIDVQNGMAYVADGPRGLHILDVSDPSHIVETGVVFPSTLCFKVEVSRGIAYLAAGGSGLLTADVSDPAHPRPLGNLPAKGYAYDLSFEGSKVALAEGWAGVRIVDVTAPENPAELGSYWSFAWARGVALRGNTVFVAQTTDGLSVLDISLLPEHPTLRAGQAVLDSDAVSVHESGGIAYVTDLNRGVLIFDVSNSSQPDIAAAYSPPAQVEDIAVAPPYAYVGTARGGIKVIDISNPTQPRQIAEIDFPGVIRKVKCAGSRLYATTIQTTVPGVGFAIFDVSDPRHPRKLANYGGSHDFEIRGDLAYLADEKTLEVINVQDASHILSLGSIRIGDFAFDVPIALSGNYAYVSNNGLQIIDVSDPANMKLLSKTQNPRGEQGTGIAVTETAAYVACHQLAVFDVTDPIHPVTKTSYNGQGFVQGVTVAGNTGYVSSGSEGVVVMDFSKPFEPTRVGVIDTPGYAHEAVADGNRLFVADRNGGMLIVDLSDQAAGQSRSRVEASALPVASRRLDAQSSARPFSAGTALTCMVSSSQDSGPGTLRECIVDSQAGNQIRFEAAVFPRSSPAVIRLQTPLPDLTRGGITLDASDSGVILDGSLLGPDASGIVIRSDDNVIRGLTIRSFPAPGPGGGVVIYGGHKNIVGGSGNQQNIIVACGSAITIDGRGSCNIIEGNYIGIEADGFTVKGNGGGVRIDAGFNNIIRANVISGNGGTMSVMNHGAQYNSFYGNLIGTDAAGKTEIGNNGGGTGSESGMQRFGGTVAGEGNIFAGSGLSLGSGTGNLVLGNRIGIGQEGRPLEQPLVRTCEYCTGVQTYDAGAYTIIGGSGPHEANQFGGLWTGIAVNSNDALIMGNYLGLSSESYVAAPNMTGIVLSGDDAFIQGNTIGFNSGAALSFNASYAIMRENRIFAQTGPIYEGETGKLQPAPVLMSATRYSAEGTTCPGCLVEVFSDPGDQAATFEGSVLADSQGNFCLQMRRPFIHRFIKATATRLGEGTSLLSRAVVVAPAGSDRRRRARTGSRSRIGH